MVTNVRQLAASAEDIELVLYETPEQNNWPSPEEYRELRRLQEEFGLSYTVHIPSHIGCVTCDRAWEDWTYSMVERAVSVFADLRPVAYVWHWEAEHFGPRPADDMRHWRAALSRLAERVASAPWTDPQMFAVETLSYPFELIEDLVASYGFSVTFDVGHLWRGGFDWESLWERCGDYVKVVHLHGIDAAGRDHKSLEYQSVSQIARLAELLRHRRLAADKVVTLEVFSQEDWQSSRRVWTEHFR